MWFFRIFPIVLVFFVLGLASADASAEQVMQARIHLAEKAQMKEIVALQLDIAYVEYGQYIDIVTDQEKVDYLRSRGYEVEVVHEDLVAFYQSRLDKAKDMGGYHTYSEVMTALDSMHTLYPSITTAKMDIGHSLEDSVIWAIKISDNPEVDEDEPEVFYNSLIHAREPAGMEVLLYFMWYLLDNYGSNPQATHLVNDREIWVVPVVNPDGYCYNEYQHPEGGGMWRKNRYYCGNGEWGVDLNRNWGYMWGYDDEGSSPYCWDETYRGSAPFSEPTTQVIRDFILSKNFVMCLDNHTYGMWLLYPWGYDRFYTPHNDLFSAIAESMAVLNGHTPGTPWECLYPVNGGSIDWEYGDTASKPMVIAISPEIGTQDDGFWPPSWRIPILNELELSSNILFAELAENPYKILPPTAPFLVAIDSVYSDYTIFWSHYDTLNPATAFELMEMTGFQRISYDVESGYSDWELDGFSVSSSRSHSPTHSFYSGEDDRLNNTVTAANSINVQPGDSLKLWCWYDIETDWDYAYVEISTNGGGSFFSIPGNVTTTYNPHGNNLGNGITGYSAGWVQGLFDLADYVGEQIYLRLRYVTDGYVTEEGFYADDIYPVEGYESSVTLSDAIADTFYQITGQEEGSYYYKVKVKDAEDQWGAWSNVETAVVSGTYVNGDANGDGNVTSSDVVFLINYLFREGTAPDPLAAGDANGDSQINSADIVYLINYLFHGGPPPTD
jgi:hypothetical protein